MAGDEHLEKLQAWKQRREKDVTLSFLPGQFKREVEKPFKQLGDLVGLWEELVPRELAAQTKLEGVSRGVLNVRVSSSSHLYELDRLLRESVENELKRRHRGPLVRVKLRVGVLEQDENRQEER